MLKVGAGIGGQLYRSDIPRHNAKCRSGDCRKLCLAHDICIPNVGELSYMARTADHECHFGKYEQLISLESLVLYFLGSRIEGKGGPGSVQCSNWNRPRLDEEQIRCMLSILLSHIQLSHICPDAAFDVRATLEVAMATLGLLKHHINRDETLFDRFSFDCQLMTATEKLFSYRSNSTVSGTTAIDRVWTPRNLDYPQLPSATCVICGVTKERSAIEAHLYVHIDTRLASTNPDTALSVRTS